MIAVDVAQPFASVHGACERLPGIVDTIARSMTLASWRRTDPQRGLAHTVITPQLGDIGILDFRRIDEIVEGGRRAARAALAQVSLGRLARNPATSFAHRSRDD